MTNQWNWESIPIDNKWWQLIYWYNSETDMKLRKPVLYHQQQYALSMIMYYQYLHCKKLMKTTVIKEMQFAFLVYKCTCRVVLHHVTINNWCGSRKYAYPPQRWSLENPRGRGSQKPNFLRTVPTIVTAHTFCASRDNRVSYRWCSIIQGYFCAV